MKWITHHRTKRRKNNKKYCKLMWKLRSLWGDEGSKAFQGCLWNKKGRKKKHSTKDLEGFALRFLSIYQHILRFTLSSIENCFHSKHFPRKTDRIQEILYDPESIFQPWKIGSTNGLWGNLKKKQKKKYKYINWAHNNFNTILPLDTLVCLGIFTVAMSKSELFNSFFFLVYF